MTSGIDIILVMETNAKRNRKLSVESRTFLVTRRNACQTQKAIVMNSHIQ